MRNMSFSMTTTQMYYDQKDVTRRLGWKFLHAGDVVMAVEKAQGLKKGEHVVKMFPIGIISTTPEALRRLLRNDEYAYKEVIREGFPNLSPREFVEFFCEGHKCTPDQVVNRIEFKRLQR